MTDKNVPVTGGIAAPAASGTGGAGRPLLAVVLALIVAATVIYALRLSHPDVPRWLLWAGAALAGLGLLALVSLVGGVLRLGGERNDRAFLDALTAAIGHPLVVTDGEGRAVYANAAYAQLSSKAGRLVGMDVLFAPYAEFSAPVYQLSQAVGDGRSESRELRVAQGAAAPCARPDQPVWVKLSATPVQTGDKPLRLWQLEDISEDRARQEQAFSRLQFIITYLDNAPAGFFSTLSDGQVDYINATLAQWLGIDLTEAQNAGMKLSDLLGPQAARLVSGVAPKPGTAVTESFGIDLRNATTGKLIPVQLVHHVEFDAEGQPSPSRTIVVPRHLAGTSAAGGEISAPRCRASSTTRPSALPRSTRTASCAWRTAPSSICRPRRGVARSSPPPSCLGERAALLQTLATALHNEGSLHQIEANVEGTTPRNVLFTFTRLAPEDDTAVVFAVDKTENKSLEVQLAQSQKLMAVGQLASGIAHDFNNVLTPIIGFADLLLAKMRPTDPAFADVMNIKQNANRAANLVRQLLAFSGSRRCSPRCMCSPRRCPTSATCSAACWARRCR